MESKMTSAMRTFNLLVERFDRITGYRYDLLDLPEIILWYESVGLWTEATALLTASRAVLFNQQPNDERTSNEYTHHGH